ncbi:MAG: hypothetical protein J5897_04655 [Candidatus Methanomethylophilus sp.]|nr:hypothetical protein [Methanomethylophilus sp.]
MTDTESTPYCIIDILPEQVPMYSPGRYFTVLRYFSSRLDEIIGKFASLLVKLNCYCHLEVGWDGENYTDDFAPEALERLFKAANSSPDPLYIRVNSSDAIFVYANGDHYMTLYEPDPELIRLVSRLASSEGLFVWSPPSTPTDPPSL